MAVSVGLKFYFMIETTKYLNEIGKEISNQEKTTLDKYSKLYYHDGKKNKIESYVFNQLKGTTYFVNSQLQLQEILSKNPNASFILLYNSGGFSFSKYIGYSNSIMDEKKVFIQNELGQNICTRIYSYNGIVVKGFNTEKSYYEDGEERYSFEYNQAGTCFLIHDMKYDQNDIYASSIGDSSKTDFTWKGMEYYEFADPIDPNNLIV